MAAVCYALVEDALLSRHSERSTHEHKELIGFLEDCYKTFWSANLTVTYMNSAGLRPMR